MVIKLISEGKANLDGCKGPFTIGDDLSAIADIKKIDLSSLGGRLQGEYEALTAETSTNLNLLTPLPIFILPVSSLCCHHPLQYHHQGHSPLHPLH